MLALFLLALAVQDPAQTGTLSGTAVNASTGAPLGKVELRATLAGGSTQASTTTDAKGNFTMVDLPAGEYRLMGMRNGYLDTYYGARHAKGEGTPIKLEAGDRIKGLELKMMPFSVLAGTVRDPDGEPIAGAAIVLLKQSYEYGRPKVERHAYFENKTDDLGQYRIANLEPGKYYVRAIARSEVEDRENQITVVNHSLKSDEPPTVIVPTLYPGVADAALARMVEVGPGAQVTGIDIPLVRAPVYHVTVIASVAPGATVDGLYLESNPESLLLSLIFQATPNKQGDFEFPAVPAGLYTMMADAWLPSLEASGKLRRFSGRLTAVRVNRDYTTRITVAQPHSFMAAHVSVEGRPEVKPPRTAMAVVGDSQGRQMSGTNTDYVPALPPDHYQVYLEDLPAGMAVKSMRIGRTDVFQNGFTVGEEAEQIDVEIVLAPEAGVVDGTVLDKDEKPAAGATVLLVAEPKLRARSDSFRAITADQYGRFHFENVRPGEYKVFAWDDIEPNAWFDTDYLKQFEDRAAPVTLQPKGHSTVQLHQM